MHIIKVEDGIVVQLWSSGKTLKTIQATLPDADIREGNAVPGQIAEEDGTFTNPPPSQAQLDGIAAVAAEQQSHDDMLDAITDPEVKAYLQAYPRR